MSKFFNMSEAASIGLHSMLLIALSDHLLNVNEISEKLSASKHHVAKVLQRLVKEDYLSSTRGPKGGFILRKKPSEITLYDIFSAIEGRQEVQHCIFETKICPFDKCMIDNVGKRFNDDIIKYLKEQTLQSYLK